jgi:molybdopterin-guanine dinucleotide biosynthesis protein
MKTVIAIGGQPATGKTTLMKGLMAFLDKKYGKNEFGQQAELITAHHWKHGGVYILGSYKEDQTFSGTDTFSMAVQPKALPWLKSLRDGSTVIYEGDRLFNQTMLESIADECDDFALECIMLDVPEETLHQRHINRGDTQTAQFLKGRATKYLGIDMNMMLQGYINHYPHETPEQGIAIIYHILDVIEKTVEAEELPF